ncbi:DNA alkylation repair protein [Brevibacillus daliensis]|uniref:DNA alkylation repair protein n=1 Tax=Brevibacillus daliensis TaxID=2892995 RepID=UPI001E4CCA99|nr:DNA alkylation repair protein [Brevibacillus daliensis]
MNLSEIMSQLESLGSEQTKKTFCRHGAREPLFGVKIGDLKKLVKIVKKDQELALALYETGNYDAMYLAGLSVNPKELTKATLEHWVQKAYTHSIAEYTVANVTAESNYALELAREWITDEKEMVATCSWSTYANYISITADDQLNLPEIKDLLTHVEKNIHKERNRVRYTMNGFVIMVGASVTPLHDAAMETARKIGIVHVDVGNTACKVPVAADYITKVENAGKLGSKKKTCICK